MSWIEEIPGPRGGLVPRQGWLPLDRVHPITGVDYSSVEHVRLTEDPAAVPAADQAGSRPAHWPPAIPLPSDDPGWVTQATAWLLDCLPPDFRAHQVVHHPHVLAWMAARHTEHALAALRTGYRRASVELKPFLEPHVIEQLLQVYRTGGRRLTEAAAAIAVVGAALRRQHPRP